MLRAYKTITIDDLKFPLIYGEGKRVRFMFPFDVIYKIQYKYNKYINKLRFQSRVLATIGVTRGFGDHELKAQNSDVYIKPFLTPQPEVMLKV